jgi:hypothetical protein
MLVPRSPYAERRAATACPTSPGQRRYLPAAGPHTGAKQRFRQDVGLFRSNHGDSCLAARIRACLPSLVQGAALRPNLSGAPLLGPRRQATTRLLVGHVAFFSVASQAQDHRADVPARNRGFGLGRGARPFAVRVRGPRSQLAGASFCQENLGRSRRSSRRPRYRCRPRRLLCPRPGEASHFSCRCLLCARRRSSAH